MLSEKMKISLRYYVEITQFECFCMTLAQTGKLFIKTLRKTEGEISLLEVIGKYLTFHQESSYPKHGRQKRNFRLCYNYSHYYIFLAKLDLSEFPLAKTDQNSLKKFSKRKFKPFPFKFSN